MNKLTYRYIILTEDIDDDYYNIHFKSGDEVKVLIDYMYNPMDKNCIIACNGYGIYTYANEGQYEDVCRGGEIIMNIN